MLRLNPQRGCYEFALVSLYDMALLMMLSEVYGNASWFNFMFVSMFHLLTTQMCPSMGFMEHANLIGIAIQ